MIYDPSLSAELIGPTVNDYPRWRLYEAAHGRPGEYVPDRTLGGTDNGWYEVLAACSLVHGFREDIRRLVLEALLRHLRIVGLGGKEQESGIYDTYYAAAVCAFLAAAELAGDDEITGLCREYLDGLVGLWTQLRHRGHVRMPGKRTVPSGVDERRDQCLRLLRGEPVASWSAAKWRNQYCMETGLVRMWAEQRGFSFRGGPFRLLDPTTVVEHEHGVVAYVEVLRKCYGFPTWATWVDHRTGKAGSISWEDVPGMTAKRAKSMGSPSGKGKPIKDLKIPKPVPDGVRLGLGAEVSRLVIGRGSDAPPDPPVPPAPPEPPDPVPPPPSGDFDPALIPDDGAHATMAFHSGPYAGGVVVVNVRRSAFTKGDADFVRWHRRPG